MAITNINQIWVGCENILYLIRLTHTHTHTHTHYKIHKQSQNSDNNRKETISGILLSNFLGFSDQFVSIELMEYKIKISKVK